MRDDTSDRAFLWTLYDALFDRTATQTETQTSLVQLRSGMSRLVLTRDFLFDQARRINAFTDERFVRAMYRIILQRDADALEFWKATIADKGRLRAFESFCDGPEVAGRYAREDSVLEETAPCGLILVTFGLKSVQLTLGAIRVETPLEVTEVNLDGVRAFLDLAGFDALGLRIARYLADMELRRSAFQRGSRT